MTDSLTRRSFLGAAAAAVAGGALTPAAAEPVLEAPFVRRPRASKFAVPFDQAREQIANKVYGQKRQVEFRKYMTKLRSQAIIEWKNDEIRKMYEAQVAKVATETPSL